LSIVTEVESDLDVGTIEDRAGDSTVGVISGDVTRGLGSIDNEEILLSILENDEKVLFVWEKDERRGDGLSVVDRVVAEGKAVPDTEEMESNILEVSVVAPTSMSMSIITSPGIMQSPSAVGLVLLEGVVA